jgi:hypothetical protein
MKKDLRMIAEIRKTMNENNLQEIVSKLHRLVLDCDDEDGYILDEFIEYFSKGDIIKFNFEEGNEKISNSGDIKDINDLNLNYYYYEYLDYESKEWIINNIKFDEVKEDIEEILQDIEEELKEAC